MYQSDNYMFRSLTDDEEAAFRTYAQENDPFNTDWSCQGGGGLGAEGRGGAGAHGGGGP